MKKLLLFLGCLLLSYSYGQAQVNIHTAQIEAFHNLMNYVEEKAGGKLTCKNANEVELQTAFDKNSVDSKLNALIDSLLNSSAQYLPKVIENVNARLYSEKAAKGKEAYKVAFTVLPDFCINMTAGMPEIWVEYWNNEHRELVENTIAELNTNIEDVLENIKSELEVLLPDDIDMNSEQNIHLVVDGNRGGYQFDNHILMDVIYGDLTDFSLFISVLKHEMHHAYYRQWFVEKMSNKERSEIDSYLYEYQRGFIFEGLAQRYDLPFASKEIKQMFANKDLIVELFDEWISVMRLAKGDSPQTALAIVQNQYGDIAVERLKRYWQGSTPPTSYANRPTVTYYVSYNLYNSIFESGGYKKLKYVIENPDKLLLVYNELYTDSMLVPRIPDDIVMMWQSNF